MLVALRVEVNIVSAFILIILLLNKRRAVKNMMDEHLYYILLCTTLLYAVSDTVAWVIDGSTSGIMRLLLYPVNIMCYLFCVIVPYIWSLYAEIRLNEDEEKLWKMNRIWSVPVIVYSLIVITTPLTGWMFSFDEKQMYQRGRLFVLQVILSLIYIILPSVRARCFLKKTSVASKRDECNNISRFIIFPLFGLFIQVMFYGISSAIITTVMGELMIYINIQNKQISLDALTGINNRGQLNRYLNVQTKKESRQGNLYMLLLDIDHFKMINDTYGHRTGDQALINMAAILQKICGRHGGFLSRYGGDEFAIVTEKKSRSDIEKLMNDLQMEIENYNRSGQSKYKLSASVGFAQYGTKEVQTIDQLIEAADNVMYQIKVKKHGEKKKSKFF